MQADTSLGAYSVQTAAHSLDPVWPDLSMRELLRIAFREQRVDTFAHPILRQLRGEV
jgi:hypothetical protein